MSCDSVSKSSTLRSPKFDDEVAVKPVPTCTPVKDWKVVQKSKSEKPTITKQKGSFTIEISNRFNGIIDESCDLNHNEVSIEIKPRSEDEQIVNKKRYKIKTKKTKTIKQKSGSNSFTKPKKSPYASPCVPKDRRCAMCLVNHTPFKKFCRWSKKKYNEKIKLENSSEDISNLPKERPGHSRNLINLIESRISVLEEKLSMNSSSTPDNNIPQDKQEQVRKMKLQKKIISTAEKCAKKFVTVYEDEGSMLKYCSKKIAKIMEDKRVPDSTGYNSIQSIVHTFDSFFYSSKDPETEILQFDGNSDLFDEDKEVPSLYGISCEIDTFTVWINFLRGFQTIWEGRYNHDLCPFYPKQDSCFFCLMRSLYTRLNKRGKTGPRSLKPFEAAYLLGQMEKSGFNWRSSMKTSSRLLIEETINHISNQEDFFKKNFEEINLNCYSCGILRDNIEERITDIDTSTLSYPVSMAEIFYKCIRIRNECSCRNERIIAEDKQKIIWISFSNPIKKANICLSFSTSIFGKSTFSAM